MEQKRQQGDILFYDAKKNFGHIRTELGKTIWYSSYCIRCDWKGCKHWAFSARIPVTFVKGRRDKRGPIATDVAPLFLLDEPQSLAGYREVSHVKTRTHDYAFLTRPCGDTLFLHRSDVVPGFEDRWRFLSIGTPVFHGVKEDEEGRFRASVVELYSLEEILDPRYEEVEPEVALVPKPEIVEHRSALLSPDRRKKTLLELTQERRNKR